MLPVIDRSIFFKRDDKKKDSAQYEATSNAILLA